MRVKAALSTFMIRPVNTSCTDEKNYSGTQLFVRQVVSSSKKTLPRSDRVEKFCSQTISSISE